MTYRQRYHQRRINQTVRCLHAATAAVEAALELGFYDAREADHGLAIQTDLLAMARIIQEHRPKNGEDL